MNNFNHFFNNDIFYNSMEVISVFTDSGKDILKLGLPFLDVEFTVEKKIITPKGLFQKSLYALTRVDIADTRTFVNSCLSFIDIPEENSYDIRLLLEAEKEFFTEKTEAENEENPENKDENRVSFISDKPLVAIYNTHNSETYIPTHGTAKIDGKNAGVHIVAETLATELEKKYGIKTILSKKIHDHPKWERAYINSAETVKEILRENPSVKIVIDIHRDAGIPNKTVTTLADGKKAATILFIVGSDKRLEHPNWQQNWEFAKKIGNKMEEMYPGLLKDVRIQSGRYNQHLHNKSILAEMGSTENTLEEAQIAAKVFAHVLSEIIKESL